MNSMAGFALGSDYLTYQVTDYDVFETFCGTLLEGLETVHKAVGLSYVARIGVRYLDAVFPRADETLEQYLLPEVMGLSAKSGRRTSTFVYRDESRHENGYSSRANYN